MVAPEQSPAAIRELDARDAALVRREVPGSAEPLLLRGLVRDWPSVAAGRTSAAALVEYLRGLDSGAPVDAIMTPPEHIRLVALPAMAESTAYQALSSGLGSGKLTVMRMPVSLNRRSSSETGISACVPTPKL